MAAVDLRDVRLAPTRTISRHATVDSGGLAVDASVCFASTQALAPASFGVNLDPGGGLPLGATVSGELASTGVGHSVEIRAGPDARQHLTLRFELLAHPARRGGVASHGEARWSLASEAVVVAIEVQVLLSGVFQRVSSDSPASCRRVRRVKQTWIRGQRASARARRSCSAHKSSTSPGDPMRPDEGIRSS